MKFEEIDRKIDTKEILKKLAFYLRQKLKFHLEIKKFQR